VCRILVLCGLALAGCEREAPDLREWGPGDHDHTTNPGPAQVPEKSTSPGSMHGIDDVTIAAWKQRCVQCHGPLGRGDGPQGPMVRASDLTRADWQASVSDEEIIGTIKNGRSAMPAFDLPDTTLQGLVRVIRLLNASRMLRTAGDGGSDGAVEPSLATRRDGGAAAERTKNSR